MITQSLKDLPLNSVHNPPQNKQTNKQTDVKVFVKSESTATVFLDYAQK